MKCKKIVIEKLGQPDKVSVLYGIIISETDEFLEFQTATRNYKVSKKVVLEINDSEREFQEDKI